MDEPTYLDNIKDFLTTPRSIFLFIVGITIIMTTGFIFNGLDDCDTSEDTRDKLKNLCISLMVFGGLFVIFSLILYNTDNSNLFHTNYGSIIAVISLALFLTGLILLTMITNNSCIDSLTTCSHIIWTLGLIMFLIGVAYSYKENKHLIDRK
jgi:hypothetical protein